MVIPVVIMQIGQTMQNNFFIFCGIFVAIVKLTGTGTVRYKEPIRGKCIRKYCKAAPTGTVHQEVGM